MDNEAEVGQIDAARGDIGRNADPRAPVAKRLKGMVALALAQFTRQRDGREAALHKAGVQPPNALAGGAEYHRAARLEKAQNVDDGMLYVAGRDADCAVFDIAIRLVASDGGDPQRILRSEKRRVGKEWVRPFKSRWS